MNVEDVRKCLHAGTNPNDTGSFSQWSVLHSAAKMKHLAIVRLLLESGAHASSATRRSGDTPLHAVGDDPAVVKALLSAGAQRGLRNHKGETPADTARVAGHHNALYALEEGRG